MVRAGGRMPQGLQRRTHASTQPRFAVAVGAVQSRRMTVGTAPREDETMPKRWWVAGTLLLFMGIAAWVRWYGVGDELLSTDEAFSWRLAQYPAADIWGRTGADVHPPLYYVCLRGWLALWGDAPARLRGFSLLTGVLCVPLLYLLCREALRPLSGHDAAADQRSTWAGLFSALLLAVHMAQVTPGRTARMYSLGVLLAGLSSWLLLRALRQQAGRAPWWLSYGLVTAAFCYTHNYAFFTICAQIWFVAGVALVRGGRGSWRQAWPPLLGLSYSGLLALLLYAPWLPMLRQQTQAVQQDYWIPPVTWSVAERVFYSWSAGLAYPGSWELSLWLVVLGTLLLGGSWQSGRAGWFCLILAASPWVLSLGFSLCTGRSIFLERCLVFGQLFYLAWLGVSWAAVPGWTAKGVLAAVIVLTCLHGVANSAHGWHDSPSVSACLAKHHQPGDVIWVDGATSNNRLRYYARQAGIDRPCIQSTADLAARSWRHFNHSAVLAAGEVVVATAPESTTQRWWRAAEGSGSAWPASPGVKRILARHFPCRAGSGFFLELLARTPKAVP